MFSLLITIFIAFFVSSLFGYIIHRSLHQPWAGRFNRSHMRHHLELYPLNDYLSESYRSAGKDNTVRTFAIVSAPVILLPIILGFLGFLTVVQVIVILVVMGGMGYLHNYLHDAFHIKNYFLNRIPIVKGIFGHWNKLHYLHHVDMQKNFGIFLFHWDYIFRTFWKA